MGVLNVTPDGEEGGIWASDTGLGVDGNGNIYVPTGNGTFNAATGGRDYGDSVEVLSGLTPEDAVIVNPPDSLESGTAVQVAENKE